MKINKFNEQKFMSVNQVLNMIPETKEEQTFLQEFKEMIKQEILMELDLSIEKLKYSLR